VSSGQRRTGGVANYEWQTGRKVEPPVDLKAVRRYVGEYLAECKRFGLNPAYHPMEDGVLAVVYHQTKAQNEAVIEAFRQLTSPRRPAATETEPTR
jgi:hypothetical protein